MMAKQVPPPRRRWARRWGAGGGGKVGGKEGGGFNPRKWWIVPWQRTKQRGRQAFDRRSGQNGRALQSGGLDGADKNKDGFFARIEMLTAATPSCSGCRSRGRPGRARVVAAQAAVAAALAAKAARNGADRLEGANDGRSQGGWISRRD